MRAKPSISSATWAILVLLLAGPAAGQAGFEADRLMPCLVEPGLVATCAANNPNEGLSLAASLDYAHHLLAAQAPGVQTSQWLVEQRLSLRTALGWTFGRSLLLSAGLDAAVHQQGTGTDGLGAPIERGPAMGRSWLGTQWILTPARWPLQAGMRMRLVLPSASHQGLAGPTRVQWRLAVLVSADMAWVRPALNLEVTTGEQIRYRNLTRDEGLLYGCGFELGGPDWPLAGLVELSGATRLRAPFRHRVDQTLEILTGLTLGRAGSLRVVLAAGFGLVGPSAPGVRGLTLLSWSPGKEKRRLEIE